MVVLLNYCLLFLTAVYTVLQYYTMHPCMQVSSGLGEAMVGISDLRRDPTNFRDREGGADTTASANPVPVHEFIAVL